MKSIDNAIKVIDEDNTKKISSSTIQELEKLKSKTISVLEKNMRLAKKEEWGGLLFDALSDGGKRIRKYFDEVIGMIERNS